MIGKLLYVFSLYHHFVSVNRLKLFHRLTLSMWHHFSFRFFFGFSRPLCVDSFVRVLLVHPPKSSIPNLSPSFVALVKSSLAPLLLSLALSSRGGAGLRAVCLFCLCIYEQ